MRRDALVSSPPINEDSGTEATNNSPNSQPNMWRRNGDWLLSELTSLQYVKQQAGCLWPRQFAIIEQKIKSQV